MSGRKATKSEAIEFNGIVFRRYPESPNWADSRYYRPHAGHIKNGVETLHREVWKSVYGPIPDGHHIHHKDGNPLNNDISNLECLPGDKHLSEYANAFQTSESRERQIRNLERIRESSHEWTKTTEGKEKLREMARKSWDDKPLHERTCTVCGKQYTTPFPTRSLYCSIACRGKVQNAKHPYLEERICEQCGQTYEINKYQPNRYCSRSCAARARNRAKGGSFRSDS